MFCEKYPTLLRAKTQVNKVESKRASQERAKFLNTWLIAHQRWNNNNNINWRSIEREIRDRQEAGRMFGVLTPGGPLWLSHWHAEQGPYIYRSAVLMLLSDYGLVMLVVRTNTFPFYDAVVDVIFLILRVLKRFWGLSFGKWFLSTIWSTGNL